MRTDRHVSRVAARFAAWTLALVATGGAAGSALAQTAKLVARPLTPYEAKFCVTNPATRKASGLANVGLGEPVYLDALVSTGTVVTSANWTLVNRPTGSAATLLASPITNATVGVFDGGDRNAYSVASRRMLIPDVQGTAFTGDYVVTVDLVLTNKTISATNTFYGSVYYGLGPKTNTQGVVFANLCQLCHADKTNGYYRTAHATAFTRKINGEAGAGFKVSCYSCHVLGYDATAGAVNGGFDDVMTQTGWTAPTNLGNAVLAATNWAAMPAALQGKANIQCENCHGPADEHARSLGENLAAVGISLSAGLCGQCHDSPTHHIRNFEWNQTRHATGYVFRATGSCAPCHSARGLIDTNDYDYVGAPMPRGTGNEGITCVTCHDPHSPGMGDYQIRSFTNVVLANSVTNRIGGLGLLCMQCHRDRYAAEAAVNGNTRQTPHHGTQGDMLIGRNAIEYGMSMPRSRHLNVLEDSCVECHMQETSTNAAAKYHVGAHTFSLRWTDSTGTTNVHLTETCVKCHGEIEDFNFGGADYDRDGVIEGVQSEIQGLMDTVAKLLPPYGTTNKPSPASSWTLSERRAAWNYLYVWEDRSHGVHNPKYASAILQASVDDLLGGIDVDRDGLLDSWEKANFGNLTSQTGAGDADGDGLSNAQEMAAGTHPNAADSDGDGFPDLAELQGGSNPLLGSSTPVTNAVFMLPAMELAYYPPTNGVPMSMHFQAVDTLRGGTWTNIGAGFVSSNAWFYQLISPREAGQKFFRVSTP